MSTQHTEDELRAALDALTCGRPIIHIPALPEDSDVILAHAIDELVERRAQQPVVPEELQQQVQELEQRSQRIDTVVQEMINDLVGAREQIL